MDSRQTNFGAGELSPYLHSRTDLPVWAKGLRTCRNFFINKHGAAMSRPGTTFVNSTRNNPTRLNAAAIALGNVGFDPVRLIAFDVADDESFVLEFGVHYIRFHTLGATVLSGGVPYEVATPYTAADIPLLKYAQVGEVLTLCSPNWDPYQLRHISDAPPSWSFTAAVSPRLKPGYYSVPKAASFSIDLAVNLSASVASLTASSTLDPDHRPREWLWMVTALLQNNATGELFETLPQAVVNAFAPGAGPADDAAYAATVQPLVNVYPGNLISIYPDTPVTLNFFALVAPPVGDYTPYTLVGVNFYRGRGSLFGYIGEATPSNAFVDVGDPPNYAIQPPAGRNPFGSVQTAGVFVDSSGTATDLHTNRPNAVTYFQQREVFGGLRTSAKEQSLEISEQGDFSNFDEHNLIDISGEALQVGLAARRRNSIRHLVSMRRLLILGSGVSYHGGGTNQLPLDYNAMDFPVIEEVGASHVTPLVVDGSCLFVRTLGRGARALVPSRDGFNYDGFDITWMAEHLFRGIGLNIIDWCHAQEPWDVVWAVRADGSVLSLTVDRSQEMMAWAQHSFGPLFTATSTDPNSAYVQSVCAVREGDEDAVYLVIVRGVNGAYVRYVERMTARHARGGAVLGPQGAFGPAVKGADGTTLSIPPDYICLDSASPYVGPAAQTFTGLGHLEGKNVMVLAQGNAPLGPFTVTGGAITLDAKLAVNVTGSDGTQKLVAYVGLPYQCELELIDIAQDRLRWKNVTHVGFEVDTSSGIEVGQDAEHVEVQPPRDVADAYGPAPLVTDIFYVPVPGDWDQRARAVLRQAQPLPACCIGLTRRIAGGP